MPDAMLPIDLRSDTVTHPTPAMRDAMMAAELGDDVLGDEPTVNLLQRRMAQLLDKDDARFVPSGTMANQLAIKSQTMPGDEIIAHEYSHIYQYEGGAWAALSGCSIFLLRGPRGQFTADDVRAAIRYDDVHFPRSSLLVVENTQNKGGGAVWTLDQIDAVTSAARDAGMKCHLDGARLWNACVASGHSPADYAQYFDSVSMCFSKGLGAPACSVTVGSREMIHQLDRYRKMLGGTMRQSGIFAGAALYALDHHVERLADDHANAKVFAEGIARLPYLSVNVDEIETNIVYFDVDASWGSAVDLVKKMEAAGVRTFDTGPQRIRAVTHLDVSREQVEHAVQLTGECVSGR